MTNTKMLEEYISASGLRKDFISSSLNLTLQGFLNKLNGKTEFKQSEICKLSKILKIPNGKVREIFLTAK